MNSRLIKVLENNYFIQEANCYVIDFNKKSGLFGITMKG